MSRNYGKPGTASSLPHRDASVHEDWTELRTLLLAPEQTQLDELRDRLDNHIVEPGDVSRVLPEAFAIRGEGDRQLSAALTPYVETGFVTAIRKSPRTIVDAIAPIMGPAIRQAIARALQSMTQSFNHTLDESLSVRGLQWRVEAWRTGKPFAEVVLLHRLRYRVEQVFLIHRETGLLLHHVASDGAVVQDQHVVSGMLTAIQNYVRDSFGAAPDQALDQFQVGDWTVWVEQGAHSYLAGVIRGTPPANLRERFRDALDHIHAQHADALAHFNGDAAPFKATHADLENCLEAHYVRPPKQGALKGWILIGLIVLGVVWWGWMAYQAQSRWSQLLDRFREEPGIVITQARSMWGNYHIEGLRDPLAKAPTALVIEAGINPATVTMEWAPFYALDAPLVLARAQSILRPPESVKFHLEGGILVATGSASPDWAGEAKRLAVLVPGISQYRDDSLMTASILALLDQINRTVIHFPSGSSTLEPSERLALDAVAANLRTVDQLASQSSQRLHLEVLGWTDATGSPARNLELSQARARAVVAVLSEKQLDKSVTVVIGTVGAQDQRGSIQEIGNRRIATLRATLRTQRQDSQTAAP